MTTTTGTTSISIGRSMRLGPTPMAVMTAISESRYSRASASSRPSIKASGRMMGRYATNCSPTCDSSKRAGMRPSAILPRISTSTPPTLTTSSTIKVARKLWVKSLSRYRSSFGMGWACFKLSDSFAAPPA